MGIKADRWIAQMAREYGMIEPFEEGQVREGVVSYGVSSYGYDIRVADEYKIFTSATGELTVIDPKHFDPKSFKDYKGPECIIPPNSFALARTVEYFRIPRDVITICLGKCLTGDTRVVDATTGDWRPIKDFVEGTGQSTLSLDRWRLRDAAVTAHLNNGVQLVYLLQTWSGLKIKATANHPFRTYQGWVALSDLQQGDRIAVARSCPVFGTSEWPEHEAILLGLLLSDGQCNTPGYSPRYTTGDPRLAEVFTEVAHAFGCEVSPVRRYAYDIVNHRGRGGISTKNCAYAWLERLGCNKRSSEKHVPSIVFTAKRESVAAFLRALFSGDGSAYRSGDGLYVEYATMSERLANDVRHLLLRFGVFARIRSKRAWTGELAYRVEITDRQMIQRFAETIGFIEGSRKQAALQELHTAVVLRPRQKSNFDTLPAAAWNTMREVAHASGHSLNAIGIKGTSPKQSLPYKIASHVAHIVGDADFSALVDADVVWDRVESITYAGIETVYDITVPDTHSFVANDVIVHNSTYARCGIIVNVTPFEPGWQGFVTLEISNTTPLPARIYSNEGIAQVLFFQGDEPPLTSYDERKGKYQGQVGVTLPKL